MPSSSETPGEEQSPGTRTPQLLVEVEHHSRGAWTCEAGWCWQDNQNKKKNRSWAGAMAVTVYLDFKRFLMCIRIIISRRRKVIATRNPLPRSDLICCILTRSPEWWNLMNVSAGTELCTYTLYLQLFLPPIRSGSHPYWITWPFCKAKLTP